MSSPASVGDIIGQIEFGGNVYPELGIFCENPYVAGLMMFVR